MLESETVENCTNDMDGNGHVDVVIIITSGEEKIIELGINSTEAADEVQVAREQFSERLS